MKKILFIIFISFITSCVSYENYYKLDKNYLARRQIETRRFDTNDEESMLIASAQVLQDLGFSIEESETEIGVITASKDRAAGSTAAAVGIIVLSAFAGTQPIYDVSQKIYVTIVSTKTKNTGFNVRVSFARIIWNNLKESRIERIDNEIIYQDFFDRLAQSLFLTANNI